MPKRRDDTKHLLRSPANASRLNEAMADIAAGNLIEFDPNAATVAALEEVERGGGKVYRGTSKQIIDAILDEGKDPE